MGGLGKIDNTHDVVSGANSSRDPNGPVYVDRRIPQFSPTVKGKDSTPARLWRYLAVHERTEAKLMRGGMRYLPAHIRATEVERAAVKADGVNWNAYTHEIDGYLDHIEHERPVNPPPDTHVDPEAAIGHHRGANKRSVMPHDAAVHGFIAAIIKAEKHRRILKRRFGYSDQDIELLAMIHKKQLKQHRKG